jgi:hypothetical protein
MTKKMTGGEVWRLVMESEQMRELYSTLYKPAKRDGIQRRRNKQLHAARLAYDTIQNNNP